MAYYFGINVGKEDFSTTAQATTTGKDVEIVINTNANVPSVEDLLLSLEKMYGQIIKTGKVW